MIDDKWSFLQFVKTDHTDLKVQCDMLKGDTQAFLRP